MWKITVTRWSSLDRDTTVYWKNDRALDLRYRSTSKKNHVAFQVFPEEEITLENWSSQKQIETVDEFPWEYWFNVHSRRAQSLANLLALGLLGPARFLRSGGGHRSTANGCPWLYLAAAILEWACNAAGEPLSRSGVGGQFVWQKWNVREAFAFIRRLSAGKLHIHVYMYLYIYSQISDGVNNKREKMRNSST